MSISRPRPQRGDFPPGTRQYGSSELGAPLLWFPAPQADSRSGLIIAGTHGDENSSIVTLSCALRTLKPELRRHHVVLTVNPDGCQLGLRANARGVDLNRNFPAANWKQGETVYRWNSAAAERDVVLLTGEQPGSERETEALCQLIHQIHPGVGGLLSPIRWPASKIRPQPAGSLAGRRLLPAAGGQRGLRHAAQGSFRQLVRRYRTPLHHRRVPAGLRRRGNGALPAGDDRSAALAGLKMKHAGAEPQRRLNVHRQPCRAVEVSEARQRRQRERGGDPARGAKHTAQHPFKSLPFRLPGQSQRFGQAARFIQFDIDHLIAPAQPRQALPGVAGPRRRKSAADERSFPAPSRRRRGAAAQASPHRGPPAADSAPPSPSLCQDSLASTISVASGAAWRIAISRSLISRSSSFTFNSWAPACHSAAALCRHLIRRANDHRLGGNHPVRQRHAQQLGQGFAFAPGLQIP